LEGKTVGQIEDGYIVSVILVRHDGKSDFHPKDNHPVKTDDMVAVLGRPDRLHQLIHDSQ
jgi:Trk K+ transport system NAD-binding subunit